MYTPYTNPESMRKVTSGTVKNPETGKTIAVGGKLYKALVKRGVVERPGELPPMERFIYVVEEDIWIRAVGARYESHLEHGYVHVKERRMMVRKTVYNTLKEEELREKREVVLEGEVAHGVLDVYDVMISILGRICTTPGMYARLRMVCKGFREVMDTGIRLEPLIRLANGRINRYKTEVHLTRFVPTMIPKVLRTYVELFPSLLVKEMKTLPVCRCYTKLVGEEGPLSDTLKASSLEWLGTIPENVRNWNCIVPWTQLRSVLQIVEVPEELLERKIWVHFQSTRSTTRTLTLREYQEQARNKKPVWPPTPPIVVPVLVPHGVAIPAAQVVEEEVPVNGGLELVENPELDEQIIAGLALEEELEAPQQVVIAEEVVEGGEQEVEEIVV